MLVGVSLFKGEQKNKTKTSVCLRVVINSIIQCLLTASSNIDEKHGARAVALDCHRTPERIVRKRDRVVRAWRTTFFDSNAVTARDALLYI